MWNFVKEMMMVNVVVMDSFSGFGISLSFMGAVFY
jgi:hypothetical protein